MRKHTSSTGHTRTLVAFLITSFLFCFSVENSARAAQGDTSFSQRGGYVISQGDLSRDKNHLGHMLTMTRTFHGPIKFLNTEAMHRFSVLYDSFYTLGEETLCFRLFLMLKHDL